MAIILAILLSWRSPAKVVVMKFLDHLVNRYGIFNSASEGDEVGVVVGFGHFGAE